MNRVEFGFCATYVPSDMAGDFDSINANSDQPPPLE